MEEKNSNNREPVHDEISKLIPDIVRGAWKSIKSPLPKLLYHYTDSNGLIGIVENKCLWATSINFLNDPDELLYGSKIIKDVLDTSNVSESFKLVVEVFFDISKDSIIDGTSNTSKIHVISFCEEPEILGQWRLYGRNGTGYCLGISFDKKYVVGPCNDDLEIGDYEFIERPKPILYDVKNQSIFLKNIFENIDKCLLNLFEIHKIDPSSNEAAKIYFSIGDYLLTKLLPFVKRPEFNEEKEWRVVVNHSNFNTKRFYRSGNNVIIPYIRLGFHEETSNTDEQGMIEFNATQVPIEKVIVGNALERSNSIMGLDILLHDNELGKCEILRSNLRFR